MHFLWFLKGLPIFSELCVWCTVWNIAKILFWIRSARKKSSDCRLLTQLSDFHFKVKLVFFSTSHIFHFPNWKISLEIKSEKYLHLRSNLTNRDCWRAIIRLSPLIGGGKWRERKSNFISLYVPQYFSSYLPQYFFIFAPNICWKSRREQLMFRSRDNRRHKYWWQVTK